MEALRSAPAVSEAAACIEASESTGPVAADPVVAAAGPDAMLHRCVIAGPRSPG